MKITCETATLADAVAKAARVAPSGGPAVHKAAGLLFEVDQAALTPLVLKSTDLEINYRQAVPVLEVEGSGLWRVPSSLLAGFLANLPLGAGQTVTLADTDDGRVALASGRTKLRLHTYATDFPIINEFDPEGMAEVEDFAARVGQVAWACHPADAPMSGVHIDGQLLVACDREKVAVVPCEMPVAEPITVPLTNLLSLLKNTQGVRVRAGGQRFELMTDDETQASTVIFGMRYVPYQRAMRDDFTLGVRVEREVMASALGRLMVLVRGEKLPRVRLTFLRDAVRLRIDAEDVGVIEDEIDASDGPEEPWEEHYTPQALLGALNAAGKPELSLRFGPRHLTSLCITDGTGWRCDLMPRSVGAAS